MTWSTNNNLTNPFSARSMTDQYLTNQALRNQRDRINQQYRNYDSTSSSESSNSSIPDTPASRALDRRLAEIEQRYKVSNASNGFDCAKLFSACFGKK